MEDTETYLIWFAMGLLLGGLIVGAFTFGPDIKVLADAICLEKHGTNFERFEYTGGWNYEIEKIICKKPVKEKDKYDGLVVEIGR